MRKSVSVIKKLLDECSDEDRGEWKNHTQTILSAVRASHPTRRGVRSAIASGFFESSAFPVLAASGWTLTRGRPADSFTFAVERGGRGVRVLIASLQQESGKPRRQGAPDQPGPVFIAQLPRRAPVLSARSGSAGTQQKDESGKAGTDRAWWFDDFDLLAVNLHAATRRWADFSYTLAAWLRPEEGRSSAIANEQLVPLDSSEGWTTDIALCLDWLNEAGARKAV
jgi:hypothetical protein